MKKLIISVVIACVCAMLLGVSSTRAQGSDDCQETSDGGCVIPDTTVPENTQPPYIPGSGDCVNQSNSSCEEISTTTVQTTECNVNHECREYHHAAPYTTVTCTDRDTATWTITNFDHDRAMTFTTNRGHSGSIAPGGSANVMYYGFDMEVYGDWPASGRYGHDTNTSFGFDDCARPVDTSSTTTSPETTLSVTTVVETTVPATTIPCDPTNYVPTPECVAATTTTTVAVPPSPVIPTNPGTPQLPETGNGDVLVVIILALLLVGAGLWMVKGSKRR